MKLVLVLSFIIHLLKGNTVYVSTNGSDKGDCVGEPCKSIDYAYDQAEEDTISVYILDSVSFPESFAPNKSDTTNVLGNPENYSTIQIPSNISSVKPVRLLNMSNLIIRFVDTTSIFFNYSSGTVQFKSVLIAALRGGLVFDKSLVYVVGTGVLNVDNLNIIDFNNSNRDGLICLGEYALAKIHKSVFNATLISNIGGPIIQLLGSSNLYVTYSSFNLVSDTQTYGSVFDIDGGKTGANNITIIASLFSGFRLNGKNGAILNLLGSLNSYLYFDDNNVTKVSTLYSIGGGALYVQGIVGLVRVLNSVFNDVHAVSGSGGAVMVDLSADTYFYNNLFIGVTSTAMAINGGGGAIALLYGVQAVLHSNSFHGTGCEGPGGAVWVVHQSAGTVLCNNSFELCSNDVGGNGGAVYVATYWTTCITYNTFIHNSAGKNGGALYVFFPGINNGTVPFIRFLLNVFVENEAIGLGDDIAFNTKDLYRPWSTDFIAACTSKTPGENKIGIEDGDGTDYANLLPMPTYYFEDVYVAPDGAQQYSCGGDLRYACSQLEYALLVTDPAVSATIHVAPGTYSNASAILVDNRILYIVGGEGANTSTITYTPIEAPYALFSVSTGVLAVKSLTFTTYKYWNPTNATFDDSFNRNLFLVLAEGELQLSAICIIPDAESSSNNNVVFGALINITGGILGINNVTIENITLQNSAAVAIGHSADIYRIDVSITYLSVTNLRRPSNNGGVVAAVLCAGNRLTISSSKFVDVAVDGKQALGGAVYLYLQDDFVSGYNFTDLTLQNNTALYGTAIFIDSLNLEGTVSAEYFNFDWKSLPDTALQGFSGRNEVVMNLKDYLSNGSGNTNGNGQPNLGFTNASAS